MWQAVFFDFDGVILDSVHIKTEAFSKLFRKYGQVMEKQAVDYHLANGGVSRFEKFKYIYRNFLGKPLEEREAVRLGEEFSGLVLQAVLGAPFIDGAVDTLEALAEKEIPVFVASGTPQEEIDHIVEARELSRYFKEVHGSPRKKPDIIGDVAGRLGLETSKCLFVGDAMTDYNAARDTAMSFFGIVPRGEPSPFPGHVAFAGSVSGILCMESKGRYDRPPGRNRSGG